MSAVVVVQELSAHKAFYCGQIGHNVTHLLFPGQVSVYQIQVTQGPGQVFG